MTDEDRPEPADSPPDPAVVLPERGLHSATDSELIALVRTGDSAAYEHLFLRHRDAATRYARRIAGPGRAEDLSAEAFTKILDLLQRGKGPQVAFRAYLLTTVRTSHLNALRAGHREELVPDHEPITRMRPVTEDPDDRFDRAAIHRAFDQLPERWRAALWLTAVEGLSNEEAGDRLGIKPNAVASLAFRARAGLRQAYLAEHLLETNDPLCRRIIDLLPSHLRSTLTSRQRHQVDEHLLTCASCTTAALELSAVDTQLSALLAPLALGGVAAAGGVLTTVKSAVSAALAQVNGWWAGAPGVIGTKVAVAATVAAVGVTVGTHEWHPEEPVADPTASVTLQDRAAPSPHARKSSPHAAPTAHTYVAAPAQPPQRSPLAPTRAESPTSSSAPTSQARGPAARTMSVGPMQNETFERDDTLWNRVTVPVAHPADNTTLHLVTTRTREARLVDPAPDSGWVCHQPLIAWLDGLLLHVVSIYCVHHGTSESSAVQLEYEVGSSSRLTAVLVPPLGYLDLSLLDNVRFLLLQH